VRTDEGLELSFNTPSKKIELYSKRMADAGLPPLPPYTRHEQPVDGQFRLLFGRTPAHTFGRTTNNRFLSEVYSENEVWLNAKAAKEQGFANGEVVTLVNQDGVRSQPVRLKVTQRIRPTVFHRPRLRPQPRAEVSRTAAWTTGARHPHRRRPVRDDGDERQLRDDRRQARAPRLSGGGGPEMGATKKRYR
jgi:anaerobic selenocysteine-containing dehydrogenase